MTERDTLPLIRTKLQKPRLPGDLIPRRRLLDPLHPGLHITAMASDPEHKQESYSDVLLQADALVCGRRSDNGITRCDLTGVGVQGTAIAVWAYRRARE